MPPIIFKDFAEKKLENYEYLNPSKFTFRKNDKVFKKVDNTGLYEKIPGYIKERSVFYQEPFTPVHDYGLAKIEKIPPNPRSRKIPSSQFNYIKEQTTTMNDWKRTEGGLYDNRNGPAKQFPLHPRSIKHKLQRSLNEKTDKITTQFKPANFSKFNIYNPHVLPDNNYNESLTQNNFIKTPSMIARENARKRFKKFKSLKQKF